MRIEANGVDVSNFIGTVTWSGDVTQMARKLAFTYLYTNLSTDIEVVEINIGNRILAYDDSGYLIFDGIVITEEFEETDIKKSITAADYAFYLKNKVYGEFKGKPAQVVRKVLSMFDIPAGEILEAAGDINILAAGDKTIYQIIEEAYGAEADGVYIKMTGTTLNIEKIGTVCVGTYTGDDFVASAKYKSSIENMVNTVAIIDGNSRLVNRTSNEDDLIYGVIQEVYKHDDEKKNAIDEARKLMKSVENSGSITINGDYSVTAGTSIIVEKVNSRIQGLFKITSDSHSITNGQHTTTITLDFTKVI